MTFIQRCTSALMVLTLAVAPGGCGILGDVTSHVGPSGQSQAAPSPNGGAQGMQQPSPPSGSSGAPSPAASGQQTTTLPVAPKSVAGLPSLRDVVAQVRPAVVQITGGTVALDFFNRPTPQQTGIGTGAILDQQGNIV